MLRLPAFKYAAPKTVEAVLATLAAHPGSARLIAGGTDLLPNLKHGIEQAELVVSLRHVPGLDQVEQQTNGSLRLGAMLTLETLSLHATVRARYPALATAAGLVAGPHHRRMGTLGGNVCLNTRCVYINQTHFWREALGYCLKQDGEACHVVKGGKRCVAAASNDTAPVLTTYGARLVIASAVRGEREIEVGDFYTQDGVFNKQIEADEMLTHVIVPAPAAGLHSAYAKLRPRNSIDFPRLSVAAAFVVDDGGAGDSRGAGTVRDLRIVVSALAARPLKLRKVAELAEGRAADEALFDELAAVAYKQCHPLTSIDGDPAYRRDMVPVYVKRVLRDALASGA